MSGAPPAKPWQISRGNATPTSVEVTQVAQQAAATQAQTNPEAAELARGDDAADATTSYGAQRQYGSAFGGTGGMYGGGGYGAGYGSSMYGSSMYGGGYGGCGSR